MTSKVKVAGDIAKMMLHETPLSSFSIAILWHNPKS